jgi:hypothetical protein
MLYLVFLASIVVGKSSSATSNQDGVSQVRHFVHTAVTSLPTSFESLPCEGRAFLLHDDPATREFLLEDNTTRDVASSPTTRCSWKDIERGGAFGLRRFIPAGYNPFGYQITELGLRFLKFDGSLDSDVGRFLTSVRTRKRFDGIKSQWLEILRMSKKGQSMRIYRSLEELVEFCLETGFLD